MGTADDGHNIGGSLDQVIQASLFTVFCGDSAGESKTDVVSDV